MVQNLLLLSGFCLFCATFEAGDHSFGRILKIKVGGNGSDEGIVSFIFFLNYVFWIVYLLPLYLVAEKMLFDLDLCCFTDFYLRWSILD